MPAKHPNIVMFAIDSIRRDHMSCYGYGRLTRRSWNRLAAGGTLLKRVQRVHPRRGVFLAPDGATL